MKLIFDDGRLNGRWIWSKQRWKRYTYLLQPTFPFLTKKSSFLYWGFHIGVFRGLKSIVSKKKRIITSSSLVYLYNGCGSDMPRVYLYQSNVAFLLCDVWWAATGKRYPRRWKWRILQQWWWRSYDRSRNGGTRGGERLQLWRWR